MAGWSQLRRLVFSQLPRASSEYRFGRDIGREVRRGLRSRRTDCWRNRRIVLCTQPAIGGGGVLGFRAGRCIRDAVNAGGRVWLVDGFELDRPRYGIAITLDVGAGLQRICRCISLADSTRRVGLARAAVSRTDFRNRSVLRRSNSIFSSPGAFL